MMTKKSQPDWPRDTVGDLTKDECQALVDRVADSKHLQKSERLRQFLFYVCERLLAGHEDEIHEVQIGQAVYNKPADYNASEDNIVRVDARRLRKALDSYFGAEGKDEPVIITVPKGSYVPSFSRRDAFAAQQEPAFAEEAGSPRAGGKIRKSGVLPWVVIVLLAAALTWQRAESRALRQALDDQDRANSSANPVLSAVFDRSHRTNIVVPDVAFPVIQRITGKRMTLANYLSRSYGDELEPRDRRWLQQSFTDFHAAQTVADIVGHLPDAEGRVQVRFPRFFELGELKVNHSVLIGSRSATPFCELFIDKRNFLYEFDERFNRSCYRNKQPLANEQAAYYNGGPDGGTDEQYGVVALLPNLGHTGNILILEGTTPAGTQAAWEFLKNRTLSQGVLDEVGIDGQGKPAAYFEVLVQTLSVAGQSRQPTYVAHRILQP